MRKVVDSNFLQSEDLRKYLAKSKSNFAVITDYAAMEAYKGDTLKSIFKSMEILSSYSRQVIILKNTLVTCGLSGRAKGLQRRLIDSGQTKDFPLFCAHLRAAKMGYAKLQKEILSMGWEATSHMDKILGDATGMVDTFDEVTKIYSIEELRLLRTGGYYTEEIIDKTFRAVMSLSRDLFANHPKIRKLPAFEVLSNTFIFRYSLCILVLILRWASTGSQKEIKPEKIRNDLVDLNFVAYGLYFDGLLTHEKKLIQIHEEAKAWLAVFQKLIK